MSFLSPFRIFSVPYRIAQISVLVLFVLSLVTYDRSSVPLSIRISILIVTWLVTPLVIGMSLQHYLRVTSRTNQSFLIGMISSICFVSTWFLVYSAFVLHLLNWATDFSLLLAFASVTMIGGIACWFVARWIQAGKAIAFTDWLALLFFLIASSGAIGSLV